jgi:hypothetical protein
VTGTRNHKPQFAGRHCLASGSGGDRTVVSVLVGQRLARSIRRHDPHGTDTHHLYDCKTLVPASVDTWSSDLAPECTRSKWIRRPYMVVRARTADARRRAPAMLSDRWRPRPKAPYAAGYSWAVGSWPGPEAAGAQTDIVI